MSERLAALSTADKGAVVMSNVLALSIVLIFLGVPGLGSFMLAKIDQDKTDAWDSDGGGGGHH